MSAVGWFWIGYGIVGLIVAKIVLWEEYDSTGELDMPVMTTVAATVLWPIVAALFLLWLLTWPLRPAGYRRQR